MFLHWLDVNRHWNMEFCLYFESLTILQVFLQFSFVRLFLSVEMPESALALMSLRVSFSSMLTQTSTMQRFLLLFHLSLILFV